MVQLMEMAAAPVLTDVQLQMEVRAPHAARCLRAALTRAPRCGRRDTERAEPLARPQVADAELYPFPIPDLFAGAPLVRARARARRRRRSSAALPCARPQTIAGMAPGVFPAAVTLLGRTADGRAFSQQVVAAGSHVIPGGRRGGHPARPPARSARAQLSLCSVL